MNETKEDLTITLKVSELEALLKEMGQAFAYHGQAIRRHAEARIAQSAVPVDVPEARQAMNLYVREADKAVDAEWDRFYEANLTLRELIKDAKQATADQA